MLAKLIVPKSTSRAWLPNGPSDTFLNSGLDEIDDLQSTDSIMWQTCPRRYFSSRTCRPVRLNVLSETFDKHLVHNRHNLPICHHIFGRVCAYHKHRDV